MFFEFAALWHPLLGGSHPRHILSYVPNISTGKILPHTSYVKDDSWNICEVVCYLGKRVFLSQPQKVICTVAKNVWLTARNFWSENIYRRFAYFLWRCLFFAKWHIMLLQSFKMSSQLSNIWWMPNSVSKGFDTAMRTGSSRRFKRHPTTYMWVSSWLPFTVD